MYHADAKIIYGLLFRERNPSQNHTYFAHGAHDFVIIAGPAGKEISPTATVKPHDAEVTSLEISRSSGASLSTPGSAFVVSSGWLLVPKVSTEGLMHGHIPYVNPCQSCSLGLQKLPQSAGAFSAESR